MKLKVENIIDLKSSEQWRVNLHSFYNVLQVLYNEHAILQNIIGKHSLTKDIKAKFDDLNHAFSDPQSTRNTLKDFDNFKTYIFNKLDDAVEEAGELTDEKLKLLEESLLSFEKTLTIAEMRTKEFLDFIINKEKWSKHTVYIMKENLKDVFLTMAIRSHGRYGVCFEEEYRMHNDYFFDLQYPPEDSSIMLPALLPDIIRDLCANAKKYSEPGTKITCKLEPTPEAISIVVRDEGRGIPPEELEKVVEYGYRADNVADKETFGDGFGLTKAYMITTHNNGTMWIDSELGKYTEVSIIIPVPK